MSTDSIPWVDSSSGNASNLTIWPQAQTHYWPYHYCSCKTEYIKIKLDPGEYETLRRVAKYDPEIAAVLNKIAPALEVAISF